jgi:long-chain acyl-CoA synthetase
VSAVPAWLEEHAIASPQREALITGSCRLSYTALAELVRTAAERFGLAGIGRGNAVCLQLRDPLAFVVGYLALLRLRAVVVPVNPALPASAVTAVLDEAGACALLVDDKASADTDSHGDAGQRVHVGQVRIRVCPGTQRHMDPDAESVAHAIDMILFTSGTTGRPKGVMLSASALEAVAKTGVEMQDLSSTSKIGLVSPLYHLYGLRDVDSSMRAGATLIIFQDLVFAGSVLKSIADEGVTHLSAVPSAMLVFADRYGDLLAACSGALSCITLGTAPSPSSLLQTLARLLPATRVVLTYGLTEASRVCYRDVTRPDDRFGSVGRPYPGVELRIEHEEGDAPDGPGRILIRTAMAMTGYWRNAETTRRVLRNDGWLVTPDYGRVDKDGFVYIHGRTDEIINCGGEKLSPEEVEGVLTSHPGVASATVVGCPDPEGRLGQVPRATVVRAKGREVDVTTLLRHCAEHLDAYKLPRSIAFSDSLPRTDLGKVDRGRVSEMLARNDGMRDGTIQPDEDV